MKTVIASMLIALSLATLAAGCAAPTSADATDSPVVLDAKALAALPAGVPFVLERDKSYEVRPSSAPLDASRVATRGPSGEAVPVGDWFEHAIASHEGDFVLRPSAAPGEKGDVRLECTEMTACWSICDASGCTVGCEIYVCKSGGGYAQ